MKHREKLGQWLLDLLSGFSVWGVSDIRVVVLLVSQSCHFLIITEIGSILGACSARGFEFFLGAQPVVCFLIPPHNVASLLVNLFWSEPVSCSCLLLNPD